MQPQAWGLNHHRGYSACPGKTDQTHNLTPASKFSGHESRSFWLYPAQDSHEQAVADNIDPERDPNH